MGLPYPAKAEQPHRSLSPSLALFFFTTLCIQNLYYSCLSVIRTGSLQSIKQTLGPPHFYLTFYLAVTNEQQLDYNIICLVFITSTKDTIH